MSLVEKALNKLREAAGPAPVAEQRAAPYVAEQRPVVPRAPVEQIFLTPEMHKKLGLVAPPEQEHQRTSEFRHIKRQLLAEIQERPDARMVLVASALAGEGKSFTSANLARSLAQEPDFSVLLIDADVLNPQLTRSLSLQGKPGLTEAITQAGVDPESLVVGTDIAGLSVLPAGGSNERATEYFGSERMREVLATLLAVPGRILVVDSLPLLLTTEARSLTPHASQLLLVVRAESTPQSAVEQALAIIGESVNVKLVLNAVVRTPLSRYIGYGTGYEYNYAGSQGARSGES